MRLVRPFTINRLADIIQLAKVSQGINAEDLEEAMMVTRERAIELLKQAEDMKLIKLDGNLYYSCNMGNIFFEAFYNEDSAKLDGVLSEYPPYSKVKNILTEMSANMAELKRQTGLTEVAIEIVLRLLDYVCDDLCCTNEKFYFRVKELPELGHFLITIKGVCDELRGNEQWGCAKQFIRVDQIASRVCVELKLSLTDFSKLFDQTLEKSMIEMHSEAASCQFLPFSNQRIDSKTYRKCYMRVKMVSQ